MGTIARNINKDIDEKIGKTMTPNDFLRLFGMIVPIKKDQSVLAAGIEKYSQEHGNYLKKIISEQNPNLDHQLAKRVDIEFRKKHPLRDGLYL